jgi:hypothetical protein
MRSRTPGDMRGHLAAFIHVAEMLSDGLAGKRQFHWGDGERQAYTVKAAALGATLVSRNQIKKQGYELKRNAKPVGTAYFGAPIQRATDLFILESQCKRREEG